MTESGELLAKADALLGRYGRRSPDGESDFPVLTEIVAPTEADLPAGSLPPDPVLTDVVDRIEPQWPADPELPVEAREGAAPFAESGLVATDDEVLRQALRERARQELHESIARLAEVLSPALQDALRERLNEAIAELSGRMRQEVDAMVKSAVERAVQRAIESLDPLPPA